MMAIVLRPPSAGDDLATLCLRSKAIWGYDPEFLARCAPVLQVSAAAVAAGLVLVADQAGTAVGVAQCHLSDDCPTTAGLDLLFVAPEAIGLGIGRLLFTAIAARAAAAGARRLTILSDPGARRFYEHMGARMTGMAPSDAIPGRMLPTLEFDLPACQPDALPA